MAIIRGDGGAFSAGGDLSMIESMADDFEARIRVMREARDIVYNVVNCSKPIVSAMAGPAVGAGLAIGLLADVSIAASRRPHHRRPHPARRRRRRPRRDHLAAAVRHGQGQVPPADVYAAVGRGGRAHRPGVAVRRRPTSWTTPPGTSPAAGRRLPERRSAGPSTRSTRGCARPGRSSTRRSAWSSSASAAPTSGRAWPRCGRSGRRSSPVRPANGTPPTPATARCASVHSRALGIATDA